MSVSFVFQSLLRTWRPTFRYLMATETHVYAFSMAANVLLSFFPFLLVMASICRHLLGWNAAEESIYLAVRDYFPAEITQFVERDLRYLVRIRKFEIFSVLLLMFTANGVFEPLEVALNRAWGIRQNRSFIRNQIVSLGLILACGGMAFVSTILTALNRQIWQSLGYGAAQITTWMSLAIFKAAAVPLTIVALTLTYRLLPNGRTDIRAIAPAAVIVGLLLEALKYIYIWGWQFFWLKLRTEYGPFYHSASIVMWSFLASMIVLAGADWAARASREALLAEASTIEVPAIIVPPEGRQPEPATEPVTESAPEAAAEPATEKPEIPSC
ncbi:MAG: YihY/virulence factor BrkB family protein [Bryobacteraceae bacterium]